MLGVPHIDTNIDRAIYSDTSSKFIRYIKSVAPAAVGPGAYGGSKFKHIKEPSPKNQVSMVPQGNPQLNIFGNDKRFKEIKQEIPGPGAYADVNKWHKKTYNLKFLNVA